MDNSKPAGDYHTPRTVDERIQRNVSAVAKIDQAEQADPGSAAS